ncbi:MAG: hypothetical protein HOD90_04715 [Nitrospina sp.]|jgi:hypothetical protein|nr:hypothetical protein [Nitrospina sp.]
MKIHIVIILILLTWLNSATAYDFSPKGSMSDGKFKRYVPPLAQPYFNETPYITTEARLVYLYNEIPKGFVTGGGSINIFAAQIRLALTERLGLIATKDGYTILKFDNVLPNSDGFENISLGFKYALFQRPEEEEIISFGIRYEPPTGSLSTGGINLQGKGDGFLDYFLTGGKSNNKWGIQGSLGIQQALDTDYNSSFFHWHAHIDYEMFKNLFPLIELNGLTAVDDGNRTEISDFEGNDAANFGSTSSKHVVSGTAGFRYRFTKNTILGVGYETALTEQKDLLEYRTNLDLTIHF